MMSIHKGFGIAKSIWLLIPLLVLTAFLYVLSEMRQLPWQTPVFDTSFNALPLKNEEKNILIFSKTNGFRHKSIEPAIKALSQAATERGWKVEATENGAAFNSNYLRSFEVVVFLSTTGDILTTDQKIAFQNYIENGGGYVGIHSASDTEHKWMWYDQLLGTHFKSHTLFPRHIVEAEIITETVDHPATKNLPERWTKEDEWYNFKENVRSKNGIQVLLSLNDASYSSVFPRRKGDDHPIAWTNRIGNGRMFYTAMGHNTETFSNPNAMKHMLGGMAWAGKF